MCLLQDWNACSIWPDTIHFKSSPYRSSIIQLARTCNGVVELFCLESRGPES